MHALKVTGMKKKNLSKKSSSGKNDRKPHIHGYQTKININSISNISTVASFGNGRLGNQMCNFASQYALYKEFGMPSYLTEYSFRLLQNTFILNHVNSTFIKFPVSVKSIENVSSLGWVHISNDLLMHNRMELLNKYKYSWLIKIEPYVCDIKGFFPYLDNLRKTYFRFQPKVLRHAKKLMKKVMRRCDENRIIVSVHVRMTDIEYHLKKLFGLSMSAPEYFTRAMLHMKRNLGNNTTFLAFSDDIEKAKNLLSSKENEQFDIQFPLFDGEAPSTRITLAILSLCKGSILTYSTFGLWGALLRSNRTNIIMPRDMIGTDIGQYVSNSGLLNKIYFI